MLPRDFKTWACALAIFAVGFALMYLACLLASIGADPQVHNYV